MKLCESLFNLLSLDDFIHSHTSYLNDYPDPQNTLQRYFQLPARLFIWVFFFKFSLSKAESSAFLSNSFLCFRVMNYIITSSAPLPWILSFISESSLPCIPSLVSHQIPLNLFTKMSLTTIINTSKFRISLLNSDYCYWPSIWSFDPFLTFLALLPTEFNLLTVQNSSYYFKKHWLLLI